MSVRRGDQRRGFSTRGQSAILGLVLLIGMVATVSVGIFLVAGETVTSLEYQSEEERVEAAMVELSQHATTSSDSTTASVRSMDIDVGQDGAVVREESGVINVSSDALEDDAIDDLPIGTIEYESDDGTKIAYEAGAVFRETGNETQVVSAPSISYSAATNTLTLPVVTTTGEERLGSGDVTLSHSETEVFQEARVVENESVTITIESDYYRGWESFFRSQAGDTSVQDIDHENRSVEVLVGYLDVEEAFNDGILVSEEFDDFENADVENGTVREGSMPQIDSIIDEMVEDMEDHDPLPKTEGTVSDDGMYYYDGDLTIDDDLAFELEEGNTTVIINGSLVVESGGEVKADATGTAENELKFYVENNFDISNGNFSVENGDASQLQVYGKSDMHAGIHPGTFEGVIYAPGDDEWGDTQNEVFDPGCTQQVCMQASVDFKGSLVASSTNVHSASPTFRYDPALEDNDISLYPSTYTLPPQLTYLNVAHHEVEVKNN